MPSRQWDEAVSKSVTRLSRITSDCLCVLIFSAHLLDLLPKPGKGRKFVAAHQQHGAWGLVGDPIVH